MTSEAIKRVRRARRRRESAELELRHAIIAAREDGETLEAIGAAAGLVRQRIWQILKGTR